MKYFDLELIREVSARLGKNELIAKELGLSLNTFKNYFYKYDYIGDDAKRDYAIKFSIAVINGKREYKIKKYTS